MQEKILSKGVLEVAVPDVQSMDKDQYALVRKDYFGASDSSVLCGVNLYKDMTKLIAEKNAKYITDEEKEVGEKPIVKKGYDLEPIILDKAQAVLKYTVEKPQDMYKFKEVNGLSVNYDGVIDVDDTLIPVEAKLVSKYGEKYYNKKLGVWTDNCPAGVPLYAKTLAEHIKKAALHVGIPAYYYTQVQQEIAGLDAPYGYLAALFDDSWDFALFTVPRDEYVINNIYSICEDNITKIKRAD